MRSAELPVSICIPLFNGADFLRECLDSVLAQTHEAVEILIVDDCSTDSGPTIVEEYRRAFPSITYVRNEKNLGLVANWNRCVRLARHDWLKFVFQDDLIAPTCVERMMHHASDPAVLIACRRDFIFDANASEQTRNLYLNNRKQIEAFFLGNDFASAFECQRIALERFGVNHFGEPTCVMLHKSFFARFGFFHEGLIMSCDLEFWIRVSIHTGARYVREPLAQFRVHERAMSAQNYQLREFHTTILDNLVLLHDFATKAVYRPLRISTWHRPIPYSLVRAFKIQRHKAYARADWARRDRLHPNGGPMRELEMFYKNFPAFRINRLVHLFWRLHLRFFGRMQGPQE